MLKMIFLDIAIFNHIFDIYNGGLGFFADFEDNKKDGNKMGMSQKKGPDDAENSLES